MSDLWPFCSSSPPPVVHHPSLSQPSPFIFSPPPLASPSSPRNHGNHHAKVTSYHLLPQPQVSSPNHLPEPQVTSPHHLPPPQVTSLQLPHPQVTPPHLFSQAPTSSPHLHQPQVTSPHLVPQYQITSTHLLHVTSPHNTPYPQVTSPHNTPYPQVTSPHNTPYPQVTSPHNTPYHQVTSPHNTPYPQVTSPHNTPYPQVTSPHNTPYPQVTSPHNTPYHQVTSPHNTPYPQVTSPHNTPYHQVTSPHNTPYPQVTSPHNTPYHQVTSPHNTPYHQVTSPHNTPYPQVTSPLNTPYPQVTSPHNTPYPQVTSPHNTPYPQVTSPHHAPYPQQVTQTHSQVTSPHFVLQPQVTSPHLLSPPQHHLHNQNHDPGLGNPNWSRCEPASELSYLPRSYSYSYQNQTTAHLDLHLQNQFSSDVTDLSDELGNTYGLPCDAHTLLASGVYEQGDTPGPAQDTWRPPGPTLSQLQGSPLGPVSGEVALGRWSADVFSNAQFFHDSCQDNNAPQPFCSPTTPGPSPHYPQAPPISSPGPQTHPREERPGFHTQAARQLNRNKTLSCCPHELDGLPMTSDPGQRHPHQTSRHLLQSQSELTQDQTGLLGPAGNSESRFSRRGRGQDVGSAAQPPGLPAGLSWREERGGGRGGGGRGGGRRRGRGGDWNWIKQPQTGNSTESLDSRLLCTVCKRDFRSLPALNGHMRSHSGSRSAAWLKKGEDFSPPVSMVMPVSVPVQSRGSTKACRGGQRRSSRLSPASGGAALYCSLLHREEEEEEEEGAAEGDGAGSSVHYTPPPMLCPLRAGPGLYCSLTARGQQRAQTVQLHNAHDGLGDLVAMEAASPPPGTLTAGLSKPRINVGRGFQADIPPPRGRKDAHGDSHNALLLWAPRDELERPTNQQRVEALLAMARSSAVPGGGASPESALHVLSECRGDFLLTVETLLSTPEASSNPSNSPAAQQRPGVSWSAEERRLLVKSLQLHHKDFSRIQKAVRTKSLAQCVEFYYLWKKQLSLSTRTPAGLTVTLPDANGQRSSRSHAAS